VLRVQFQGAGPFDGTDPDEAAIFSTDRSTLQRLSNARELLGNERYGEATRLLGSILESAQDFFFQPDKEQPLHRSLKTEAERLIGSLPRAGREAYELQFGAQAEQLLNQAVESFDRPALADVSRKFFHTPAGRTATFLLAFDHLDHGRPLAGALCLERLRNSGAKLDTYEPALSLALIESWQRAGQPDKAGVVAEEVARQFGGDRIQWNGQSTTVPAQAKELLALLVPNDHSPARPSQALSQWLTVRGDATRNAISPGGLPLLNARWRIPNTTDPLVEKDVDQLRRQQHDLNRRYLPSMHPLVVDQVVIMRTIENLLAVDLRTGKRLWEVPSDDTYPSITGVTAIRGVITPGRNGMMLGQRLWADNTFGMLSSDGQYVFSVEDLNLSLGIGGPRTIVLANGRQQPLAPGPKSFNRLAAHEIRTGKLKWELGGPEGDASLTEAGNFFLGAPLALAGRLYALAERSGEIRLISIDAKSGTVDWAQQLVVVEDSIIQNQRRRMAGVTPSYNDGVLVCPTGAGAVVAVDLTTRALLWGYRYADAAEDPEANQRVPMPRVMIGGVRIHDPNEPVQNDQWVDSTATIAGDKILLTPVESQQIHCVNLITGELLWRTPREDGLYVGGVFGQTILVVGRQQVRGLNLADGSSLWDDDAIKLAPDATTSGRGFRTEDRYCLPLSSAEVIVIDPAKGQIVGRTKSRRPVAPGNLICHAGGIISQSTDAVESFYQTEELQRLVDRRLKEQPADPVALSLSGELLLEQGRLDQAVASLRSSFKHRPDPRTRQLLAEALLLGLRDNFATYRNSADELQGLLDRPQQQAEFLRLMASGLIQEKETLAAFELLMRFVDPRLGEPELQRVDITLEVRRDRWVRAQLAAMRESAPAEQRNRIDEVVGKHLETAVAAGQAEPLRQFLRYFGDHPLAIQARQQLIERLDPAGEPLELELELRHVERHGTPTQTRWAVARLADLMRLVGRPSDAAVYYRKLSGEWADEICRDGKTGRQIVAALAPDSPVARRLTVSDPFPQGKIEKQRGPSSQATNHYVGLLKFGSSEPFLKDLSIELDQARPGQPIIARDGYGREAWRVPLFDVSQTVGFEVAPGFNHVASYGHLLMVSMGKKVFAIDSLGGPSAGAARLAWSQETLDSVPGMPANQVIQTQPVQLDWGPMRFSAADAYGRTISHVGPVTGQYVCYQRNRDLIAADPLSGQTLWRREGILAGSECFGDDEAVFLVSPNSREALVLRAVDGRQQGTRQLPPAEQRMLCYGRNVLVWAPSGDQVTIRLWDAFTGLDHWQRQVPLGSKAEVIGCEWVGIAEPAGRFTLLDLNTGTPRIDSPIEPEESLSEIHLLESPDRFLLITNRPWEPNKQVYPRAIPGGYDNRLVNGHVYGFDRQSGEKVWTRAVERQAILLRQPTEIPVLTFACHIYERPTPEKPQNSNHFSVLCLDKRNGRILHQEQSSIPLTSFDLTADPDRKTAELNLMRETIQIGFTDNPLDPAESADSPPETPQLPEEAPDEEP
jgi:outer membrane protein assembly factor BamB/tetratricopeptide (TPR) repeat protein